MSMLNYFFNIEGKDWVVVFATLAGPILAVQAQKWIELLRENRRRKTFLFEQLMGTRASRLSQEHVRALNMIDIVFYGSTKFGVLRRSKSEQAVLDKWKEYLDHLCNKLPHQTDESWFDTGNELFTDLLFNIAKDLDYTFDRVQLKRSAYSPLGHEEIQSEINALRKSALSVVKGESALKMNVVGFPVDPEAIEANKAVIQNLGKALATGTLRVEITAKD